MSAPAPDPPDWQNARRRICGPRTELILPLNRPPYSSSADWLQPAEEQEGLSRYVETIRERFWVILAAVIVTTGIAILYVADRDQDLRGDHRHADHPDHRGRPGADQPRAAARIGRPDPGRADRLAADRQHRRRRSEHEKTSDTDETPEALLAGVSAEPVANSNIVAVTATETSPAYAQKSPTPSPSRRRGTDRAPAPADRNPPPPPRSDRQVRPQHRRADGSGGVSVAAQIAELQALAVGAGPDDAGADARLAALRPGLPEKNPQHHRRSDRRPDPRHRRRLRPAGPRPAPAPGVAAATPLPPAGPGPDTKAPRSRSDRPLSPGRTSPFISEAYRTLRATLAGVGAPRRRRQGRVILVTGSSPSEGKTTSARQSRRLAGAAGQTRGPDRVRPAPAGARRASSTPALRTAAWSAS